MQRDPSAKFYIEARRPFFSCACKTEHTCGGIDTQRSCACEAEHTCGGPRLMEQMQQSQQFRAD